MKIDTVLFDLDGTLIDTNELIIASFKHTFRHFFPEDFRDFDLSPFIGEPLLDSFKRIDEERADDMLTVYRKHNLENHDLLIQQFDGVFETVEELKKLGVKLAVVTNKMRMTAKKGLQVTGLDQFFDVVVAFDDVQRGKPHPDALEKAMKDLEAKPETTIMVGDSQYDIDGGKNAGTFTAGVSWSLKGKDFIASCKPDVIIDHMSELLPIVGEQSI